MRGRAFRVIPGRQGRATMKRAAILGLHIAVMACSVGAWLWTDEMTWNYGGAAWAFWIAAWQARDKAIERNDVATADGAEEELAPLKQEAARWGFWRQTAWYTSIGILVVSLLLVVRVRSKTAVACHRAPQFRPLLSAPN